MVESQHIIFIPESQQTPDEFTEVVNEIPAGIKPRIVPWSGSVSAGVQAVESILDREEIRRVILVGAGTGAGVALEIAKNQPRRVERLVLDSPLVTFDEKQLKGMSTAENDARILLPKEEQERPPAAGRRSPYCSSDGIFRDYHADVNHPRLRCEGWN